MKLCLIGGLGFVGHTLAKELIKNNEVVIIDNKTNYNSLDPNELKWLFPARINRINGATIYFNDVNNHSAISKILNYESPDFVVYLAAYPRAKLVDDNIDLATKTMISGLENAAILSKNLGAHFGFISSSMVYGEWPSLSIDENYPPNPIGNYGNLKYLGEQLLKVIYPPDKFFIVRLTGVYGPWDATDRVVSKMFKNAMSDEDIVVHGQDTKLDLTYINDAVAGLSSAIIKKAQGTFNISSGIAISLLELATVIKEVANSKSNIIVVGHDQRYPQRGALIYDKAMHQLNYKPNTSLYEGLSIYHHWLLNN